MTSSQRVNATESSDRPQAGVAFIEFLFVVPLMLGLTFFVIEVARFLKVAQAATVLAREAANVTYRQCADIPFDGNLAAFQADVASCISTNVVTAAGTLGTSAATQLSDGARITLVINVYRNGVAANPLIASVTNSATGTKLAFAVGSGISDGSRVYLSDTDFATRDRAVTAEVLYPFRDWLHQVPFLASIAFTNVISGQGYYEVAVL